MDALIPTKEFIKIIDNFMEETNVRTYCRTVCKGEECCKSIECQKCIGDDHLQPITCRAFLCNDIVEGIRETPIYKIYHECLYGLLDYFHSFKNNSATNTYNEEEIQPIYIPKSFARFYLSNVAKREISNRIKYMLNICEYWSPETRMCKKPEYIIAYCKGYGKGMCEIYNDD